MHLYSVTHTHVKIEDIILYQLQKSSGSVTYALHAASSAELPSSVEASSALGGSTSQKLRTKQVETPW